MQYRFAVNFGTLSTVHNLFDVDILTTRENQKVSEAEKRVDLFYSFQTENVTYSLCTISIHSFISNS